MTNTSSTKKRLLTYFTYWTSIACIAGLLIGSASALFLFTLEKSTLYRENHPFLLLGLPLGGLLISYLYRRFGGYSSRGNNLLLEEFRFPEHQIPLRMAPLVFFGTIVTHLFGGSAGREGTAVQMGGAIAEGIHRFLKTPLTAENRKIFILIGIASGFASVFGTPWAGFLFAFELTLSGTLLYRALLPVCLSAFIAHQTCVSYGIPHAVYRISEIPNPSPVLYIGLLACILCFGLAARVFIHSIHLCSRFFSKLSSSKLWVPFWGGAFFILLYGLVGTQEVLGLGIPTISSAFDNIQPLSIFGLKLIFTCITLGSGFKGGEVTPLFFLGATLGSYLAGLIGIPVSFLTALGFVSVFSGATKTPLACTAMGMELFGISFFPYLAIACFIALSISGSLSIYSSQKNFYMEYLQKILKKQKKCFKEFTNT